MERLAPQFTDSALRHVVAVAIQEEDMTLKLFGEEGVAIQPIGGDDQFVVGNLYTADLFVSMLEHITGKPFVGIEDFTSQFQWVRVDYGRKRGIAEAENYRAGSDSSEEID